MPLWNSSVEFCHGGVACGTVSYRTVVEQFSSVLSRYGAVISSQVTLWYSVARFCRVSVVLRAVLWSKVAVK